MEGTITVPLMHTIECSTLWDTREHKTPLSQKHKTPAAANTACTAPAVRLRIVQTPAYGSDRENKCTRPRRNRATTTSLQNQNRCADRGYQAPVSPRQNRLITHKFRITPIKILPFRSAFRVCRPSRHRPTQPRLACTPAPRPQQEKRPSSGRPPPYSTRRHKYMKERTRKKNRSSSTPSLVFYNSSAELLFLPSASPFPTQPQSSRRIHCSDPGYGGSLSEYLLAIPGGTKRPPR